MDKTALRKHLSETAAHNVERWLTESKYELYREELQELIDEERWKDLEDAFFKDIEFGTGGRRGMTGVGSNRINRVTVGESAQALCEYARSVDASAPKKGVVIACDTRVSSPELSKFAASVCAANGFTTYIFESFRSTPELSFAIRELGCAVGIVISASHNPPTDNGFKAYWSDGGQLVTPHDKGVLATAAKMTEIRSVDYDTAVKQGGIQVVSKAIDDAYIAAVTAEAIGSERNVKIVYSPLHGAGQTNVLPALRAAGFTDISVVEEQMVPDGTFPTIENGKPNPEERLANERAVAQLMSEDADIAITNDPDADRIGVMCRQDDEPVYLSGNQSAVLAADFVLSKLQERGELTNKHYLVKTIVTTDMLDALAKHYGVTCYGNLLVGFKFISEVIRNKENTDEVFVTGSEESYGLLKGTYARDKDGATGALPLAEYAAELKSTGKTLWDRLLELFETHGLFVERLDNVMYPGASGFERMQEIMTRLRTAPPEVVGDYTVTAVLDYQTQTKRDIVTGAETPLDCIKGNVIALELGDPRRRVTVRPSGTEPKIKLYAQWFEKPNHNIEDQYYETVRELEGVSKELEGWLLA